MSTCAELFGTSRQARRRADEAREEILEQWDPVFGDRRQELVFIGHDLDRNGFVGRLEAALMTDIELVGGRDAARRLLDPWPRWGTDAVHEYGHESGGVGQAAA